MRIQDLQNGYYRLTADEGMRLYCNTTHKYVSEAIIEPKSLPNFEEREAAKGKKKA